MTDEKSENIFVDNLQKLDLDQDEALIYFTLLKNGKSGTIARKLNEELFSIERTRIYSILRKLIEKGCVKKGPPSEDARKPKKFIAVDPRHYFELMMENIQLKIDELEEFRETILEELSTIFEKAKEIHENNLEPFIVPYFKQLIEHGWKVIDQKIIKGLNLFGGESTYEYSLTPPIEYQKFLKLMGLIACVYDTKVDLEPGVIKFVIGQIKNVIKVTHDPDFNNLTITERSLRLEGIEVFSLNIVVQEKKSKKIIEFGKTLIIPINNKIFFIWEELNHEMETIQQEELLKVLNEFSKPFIEIEK
ncbi:MAG: helix-turn-helix domain-containing protein [Promethearchaeota archaeon]